MRRVLAIVCALCAVCSLGMDSARRADALDDVLALVPSDATSVIVIPSLAKMSGDIDACVAGMDRKETVIAGRPVDQLRGALGIREGFDERGSMAAWTTAAAPDAAGVTGVRPYVLLIPSEDPPAFVTANLAPNAEGIGTFRGERVYSKALAKHVIVSSDRASIDSYDAKGGIGAPFAAKFAGRGMHLAHRGDLIAWGDSQTAASLSREDGSPDGMAREFVANISALRTLFAGVSDVLLVVDADPLGLSLRALAMIGGESDLAKLAASATPVDGESGATLRGLPKAPMYFALAIDAQSLGGADKIDDLTTALGLGDVIPAWFAEAKEGVRAVRVAAYPSKLGILAGGLFNDCAVVIETDTPDAFRLLFKKSLLGSAGKADGVRREPVWEEAQTLKDGSVVDAFELKETPLGPSEADGADLSGVAMQQLARQAMFGSRGMHGFVKILPSAVVITLSQRPDVLARAIAAARGGESLSADSVLVSMRPWIIPGAQIEAFISVGQILKVVRQLAQTFGGGGMQLPSIPTKSPPIAFAFRVSPQSAEAAAMIPTATLAAVYDQMMSGAMGARRGEEKPPTNLDTSPATPQSPAPESAKE